MNLRLVDRKHIGSYLRQMEKSHRRKMPRNSRPLYQQHLLIASTHEDRHVIEQFADSHIRHTPDGEVLLGDRAGHRATEMSRHAAKQFADRLISGKLIVETVKQSPQPLLVDA